MNKKLLEQIQNAIFKNDFVSLSKLLGCSPAEAKSVIQKSVGKYGGGAVGASAAATDSGFLQKLTGFLGGKFDFLSKGVLGGFKTFTDSIADGLDTVLTSFNGRVNEDFGDITDFASKLVKNAKNLDVIGSIGTVAKQAISSLAQGVGNIYQAEVEAREAINRQLGVGESLAKEYRDTMVDAYAKTKLFGATFEDVKSIVDGVTTSLGRVQFLNSKTIEDIYMIQKTFGLDSKAIAAAAGAFEDVSIGVADSAKQVQKAGEYARASGLKVNDYIGKLTQNMKLLNSYGFKDGVQGLERMLAKAQSLRMEMDTVAGVAEKVFDPEGAIEMAANMNAIGGALGSFGDPLKMLYQATNDMEGLQDSIVAAARSLVTFNTESGRFEVVGANLRRARDMAKATGVSLEQLTSTGVRAAQRLQAIGQIDMLGKNFSTEQKDFLSNIASMHDGKLTISLPDNIKDQFGNAAKDGFLDVSQLNKEGVDKLKTLMDKYNSDLNKKPQELMMQQIGELDAIKNLIGAIATKLSVRMMRTPTVTNARAAIRNYTNDAEQAQAITDLADKKLTAYGKEAVNIMAHPMDAMKSLTESVKNYVTGGNLIDRSKDAIQKGWNSMKGAMTPAGKPVGIKHPNAHGPVKHAPSAKPATHSTHKPPVHGAAQQPTTAAKQPNVQPVSSVSHSAKPQAVRPTTPPQHTAAVNHHHTVVKSTNTTLQPQVLPGNVKAKITNDTLKTHVVNPGDLVRPVDTKHIDVPNLVPQAPQAVPIVKPPAPSPVNLKIEPSLPDNGSSSQIKSTTPQLQPAAPVENNFIRPSETIFRSVPQPVQSSVSFQPVPQANKTVPAVPRQDAIMQKVGEVPQSTSQAQTKEAPEAKRDTSATVAKQEKNVNVNLKITSDQTIYDNISRQMLNDSSFIATMKRKFEDINF